MAPVPQNRLRFDCAEVLRKLCGKSMGPYPIALQEQRQFSGSYRLAENCRRWDSTLITCQPTTHSMSRSNSQRK
jgi:hypothetical protein